MEFYCYRRFSTDPERPSFSDIIFANLTSWFAGMVIGFLLPSGLVHKAAPSGSEPILTQGPRFTTFAIAAFFVACILSIVIEFWALRWSARQHRIDGLFRLSAIANVASYLVLGVLVWAWVTWIW